MQQRQKVRNDSLDRVGDKHLVAVKLDLVLLHLQIILDPGKVKDPRQIERIIDIEMNVEEGLIGHRIEPAVEIKVILVGKIGRFAGPGGIGFVDLVILVGFHLFPVLPGFLLAENYRNGQELAVFLEYFSDLALLEEFFRLPADMHDHIGTHTLLRGLFEGVFWTPLAAPFHRGCTLLP